MTKSPRIRRATTLTAVGLMAGALLTGCGEATSSTDGEPTPSVEATSTTEGTESTVDQNALLEVNERLSAELGDSFVQAWVEDGKLNVSTTDESELAAIEAEGAVGHLVDFSNAELREGISKIMAWQAKQDPELRGSIHAYTLNPHTGGITLAVDPTQRMAVEEQLEKDRPVGDIPLDFTNSGGFATPASAGIGTN